MNLTQEISVSASIPRYLHLDLLKKTWMMAPLVTTTRDFAFFAAHVCPITLIIQRINAQFQLWVLPLHTAFFFF